MPIKILKYPHYKVLMLRADFPNITSANIASCPLGDIFTIQGTEIKGYLKKGLPCVL